MYKGLNFGEHNRILVGFGNSFVCDLLLVSLLVEKDIFPRNCKRLIRNVKIEMSAKNGRFMFFLDSV